MDLLRPFWEPAPKLWELGGNPEDVCHSAIYTPERCHKQNPAFLLGGWGLRGVVLK